MTRSFTTACVLAGLAHSPPARAEPAPAEAPRAARIERFEIRARSDAFAGANFGETGTYERIDAVAHVTLDPAHAANREIADVALAPRDADGRVAYDTDVTILRPRNARAANRTLLFEVVNRGNRHALGVLNDAPRGGALDTAASAGNGFAMKQGYTLVWAGWQADVSGAGVMSARFPVAQENGAAITGRVQVEVVFDHTDQPGRIALPYAADTLDPSQATLSVRQRQGDAPRPIPGTAFRFVDARAVEVTRPSDMDAGAIYELVYTAREPVITGLGFAATRDVVAFLRFGARDAEGVPNPLAGQIDRALAIGFSQSGRYLRDWLWRGFHVDGDGRPVFEGVLPFIAGARKTFTNTRWAQPGRFSRQHEEHRVPGNQFPFGYAVTTDPITSERDGIFARCEPSKSCPKLMHVDTSSEFWQAAASLVGSDGAGRDVAFPENVRAYLLAGASHAPGFAAPHCELPPNPVTYGGVARALLVAMERWVRGEKQPPASVWPLIARGELVAPPEAGPRPNAVERIDYGRVPPAITGPGWSVLVPKTDADGNDAPGIALHALHESRGVQLGWNVRRAGFAKGELCFVFGGSKPAPPRESGDPHPIARAKVAFELWQARLLLGPEYHAIAKAALESTTTR